MLKKGVAALVVVLLVAAVWGTTISRYSAIKIVRLWLPSDWSLDQLTKLSLDWRGGSVERLAVTIPQGALLADEVQWQWQLRLNLQQPVTVVSVSSRRAVWRSAQSPAATVPRSAESTQNRFQLDDFRRSSWWPASPSWPVDAALELPDALEDLPKNAKKAYLQYLPQLQLDGDQHPRRTRRRPLKYERRGEPARTDNHDDCDHGEDPPRLARGVLEVVQVGHAHLRRPRIMGRRAGRMRGAAH